ncbi:HAMP domain-containing protein [Vacuolonema iberomarrocanum]|uniref:HAMP domain-containing protein n=1 Tax=Vacuolonema iberomarrocanum TaxID=3454632 RepID=UPI001A06BC34|nr:hypothetical protein [filamentous cyanobacterium LEGE 07170]
MNSLPKPIKTPTKQRFLSLRWRLLAGFTLVFSAVFAGAYYWFYAFSTEKAMTRLIEDLKHTAEGTAAGLDVSELLELYEEGDRNAAGYSDDLRYQNQMDWFETVHYIEPRVYPYTFLIGEQEDNRRVGEAEVEPGDLEVIYLVDSLWLFNQDKALSFLESGRPSSYSLTTFEEGTGQFRDLYTDPWGSWISYYLPLEDSSGDVVAVLGADIEADHVLEVQKAIRDRIWVAFGITYGTLLLLVYLLSDVLTRRLNHLTLAAGKIGEGDYDQNLTAFSESAWQDEISKLSKVFELMVSKVRKREETLKQQVAELKIEIDQVKRDKQVREIVETDFFQDLMGKARDMRGRISSREETLQDPPPA